MDTSSIAFDTHHVLEASSLPGPKKGSGKRKDSKDEILEMMETKIRNDKENTLKIFDEIKNSKIVDDNDVENQDESL